MRNRGIQLTQEYKLSFKIIKDEDSKITQGLLVGSITAQNQAILLACQKGEIKGYPTVGVGIQSMLNDHDFRFWKREIIAQLEADGQIINKLQITANQFILEAYYP